MDILSFSIKPQYVKLTDAIGKFPNGKGSYIEFPLHLVQQKMKEEFNSFPEFTIISAPTGTGKSYAFPFPVLNSIANNRFSSSIRGLIVLPTNALIDELFENFTDTFANLKIGKITGKRLNEFGLKGFNRWEKALEIVQENDIIITNPDIINYAMYGGYNALKSDKKSGRKEFPNFLQKVDYIIFDEYHLYDESQIANLITLTHLRDIFLIENQKIKYFFVSATPEPGLKTLLEDLKLEFTEIIEEIVEEQPKARVIHGKLEVEISHSPNFFQLLETKYNEIEVQINNKRKVLIIFDKLIDLQNFKEIIQKKFSQYKIVSSSGYAPEDENLTEAIKSANIIIATNKAEVGVNYDVEYAIMQSGKFYRNFVQRFGRVSRGDKEGKIVIGLTEMVQVNQFKKALTKSEFSYYEFLEIANSVFQSKKFYNVIIPSLIGEYLWCIQNNLKHQEWFTREFFKLRLNEIDFWHSKFYPKYKLFNDINDKIKAMQEKFKYGTLTKEWTFWWGNYLKTYYAFRDSSKVVQIFDEKFGIELSYSLDWILQYKMILKIETKEINGKTVEKYFVGDSKNRDKDIEYHISTIPTLIKDLPFIAQYEKMQTDKLIQELFAGKISQLLKSKKKGLETIDTMQIELLEKLSELAKTFNRKRIKIERIISNNQFL